MSQLYLQGIESLRFDLVRGSNLPSSAISFVVSSGSLSLAQNVTLSSTGLFEYSVSPFSTWGSVSFNSGQVVPETIVQVRAKPTNSLSIPSGNLTIGSSNLAYSIFVDSSQKIEILTAPSDQETLLKGIKTSVSNNITNFVSTSPIVISARFLNFDLLPSAEFKVIGNPNAVRVGTSITSSVSLGSSASSLITIGSSNHVLYFNVGRLTHYSFNTPVSKVNWELVCNYGSNQSFRIQKGGFVFDSPNCDVFGELPALSGESGSIGNPSSFRIVAKKVAPTDYLKISATLGFKVSLNEKASIGDLSSTLLLPLNSSNHVLDDFVYVYLDPFSVSGEKSGSVTVEIGSSQTNTIPIKQLSVAGNLSKASVVPLLKTKNIVMPGQTPFKSLQLYFENAETTSLSLTSLPNLSTSYSFIPLVLGETVAEDEEELAFFTENPVTTLNLDTGSSSLSNFTSSVPSLPGVARIKLEWPDFFDSVNQVDFSGGSVEAEYSIFPPSNSSVYFNQTKYLEFELVNGFVDSFAYTPANLVLKNINGTNETINLSFLVTKCSGSDYLNSPYFSNLFPTKSGEYNVVFDYLEDPSLFSVISVEGDLLPHGFSNGDSLTNLQLENPSSLLFVGTSSQNYNSTNWVVEKVNNYYFRIKTGVSDYFKARGAVGSYGQVFATGVRSGTTFNFFLIPEKLKNVDLPKQFLEKTDFFKFFVFQRTLKFSFCADAVFPNNLPSSATFRVRGLLADDVSQNNVSFSFPTNNSHALKSTTTNSFAEISNEKFGNGQYYLSSFNLAVQGGSFLNRYKYQISLSQKGNYFRRLVYANRPSLNLTKTYDQQSWGDATSSFVLPLNSDLVSEFSPTFSLSAFEQVTETSSNAFPANNSGIYFAYPELSIQQNLNSQLNQDNYLFVLNDQRIGELTVNKKEAFLGNTLNQPLTKVYDSTSRIQVNIPLSGVIENDNLYIQELIFSSSAVGTYAATSLVLGGSSSNNYQVNLATSPGWNSTPRISITKRPIRFRVTYERDYLGATNSAVPVLTKIISGSSRIATEPVCFSPIVFSFSNGNAGTKTSTTPLTLVGASLSNYDLTFEAGSNTLGQNVFGVIRPISLTLQPQASFNLNYDPIVFTNSVDISSFVQNTLNANTLTSSPDVLTKQDLDFVATINNANRGPGRTLSFVLRGLSSSSPFKNNYIVSAATRTLGPITVAPKTLQQQTLVSVAFDLPTSLGGSNRVISNLNVDHNLVEGDRVVFKDISHQKIGVSPAKNYYVRNPLSNRSFQLSETPTGPIINFFSYSGRVNVTSVVGSSTITANAHPFTDKQRVMFTSLTNLPSFALFTPYFVRFLSNNTYALSLTETGALIVPTTSGQGVMTNLMTANCWNNTLIGQSLSIEGLRGSDNPSVVFLNREPSLNLELPEPTSGTTLTAKTVFKITTNANGEFLATQVAEGQAINAGLYEIRFTFPNSQNPDSPSNYTLNSGYVFANFLISKRVVFVNTATAAPIVYGEGTWPNATILFSQESIVNRLEGHDSGLNAVGVYLGLQDLPPESSPQDIFVPQSYINLTWFLTDYENYEIDSAQNVSRIVGLVSRKTPTFASVEDPITKSKVYDGTTSGPLNLKWGSNQTIPAISGIVDNGQVVRVTVTESSLFSTGTVPTVTFSAPPANGVRATGIAQMMPGPTGTSIVGIEITNAGSGYTTAPSITISNTNIVSGSSFPKANCLIAPPVTVASVVSTFDSPVASGNAVLRSFATLQGLRSSNYFSPSRVGVGTITKKPLTFSGIRSGAKPFDGNNAALLVVNDFRYEGLIASDLAANPNLDKIIVGNLTAYFSSSNSGINKSVFQITVVHVIQDLGQLSRRG